MCFKKQFAIVFTTILCSGLAFAGEPKSLPPFSLPDLEGKTVMSGEWKGKVVLIDFWATWCAACREAFPILADLQSKYGSKLVVAGISTDKASATKLTKFVKKSKLNYLVLHDAEEKVASLFGFSALPSLYVYSSSGQLLAYFQGLEKENRAKLERLLAEQMP